MVRSLAQAMLVLFSLSGARKSNSWTTNGSPLFLGTLLCLLTCPLSTVQVESISPRDPNPDPNAPSNYWQMVWSCREARYRATYRPVKLPRSGSSPFCLPRQFLAARRLIDLDPDKPTLAKGYFVDRAIDDAVFILERIDERRPSIVNTFAAKG